MNKIMSKEMNKKQSIGEFYNGKSVLVTGATGFVGKLLIWKLLVSCLGIEKIYLLIRNKRGKSVNERFRELIDKSGGLFKWCDESLLSKLIPIEGDVLNTGLGISELNEMEITNSVSIVYHCAADISFESNLREHILNNIGGTKEVIDFCRKINNLEVLIHVSTTFSNPHVNVIEEKVYDSHVNPYEILEMAKNYDEIKKDDILGPFPNIYSFSKNLGENLIKREWSNGDIPMAIVRPGIIFFSIKEPTVGWSDAVNGIIGSVALGASGILRLYPCILSSRVDTIPVDIVINTCITASWITANKFSSELKVYNCNNMCINSLTHKEYFDFHLKLYNKYPIASALRPVKDVTRKFMYFPVVFQLIRFFTETCFGYFYDFLLLISGQKPKVSKYVRLMHKYINVLNFASGRIWKYKNDNFIGLSSEQIANDNEIFNCDVRKINLKEYYKNAFIGSKKFLFRETDDDTRRADFRMKMVTIGYSFITFMFRFVLCSLLLLILYMFNFITCFMYALKLVLICTSLWSFYPFLFIFMPQNTDELEW